MTKIGVSKRHRPACWPAGPLPADPPDRDIVRAKQLAGRSRPPGAASAPATQSLTGAAPTRRIVMSSASGAAPARPPAALADLLPCQRGRGELWFSELPAELEQAKAYCQQCPLRAACLAGAVERAEPCGVWGGEIFHRGAILARKRPRGRPPRTKPDAGQGHCSLPTTQRGDHASVHP